MEMEASTMMNEEAFNVSRFLIVTTVSEQKLLFSFIDRDFPSRSEVAELRSLLSLSKIKEKLVKIRRQEGEAMTSQETHVDNMGDPP